MRRRTARGIGVGASGCARGWRGATDFVSVSVDGTGTSFVGIVRRAGFEKHRSFVGWLVQTNVAFCSRVSGTSERSDARRCLDGDVCVS